MPRIRYYLAASGLFLAVFSASAQTPPTPRWEYWRHAGEYIHDQAGAVFSLAGKVLDSEPPSTRPSDSRRLALAALDALLHDTDLDGSGEFHAFVDGRMEKIADQLGDKCSNGLEIFKLYNAGFIVRTKKLTVGFDLCAKRGDVTIVPPRLMSRMIGCCDVLFISHRDPDHADASVIAEAARQGVPVYGPKDIPNPLVTGIRCEDFSETELVTRSGKVLVQPLPGHQDDIENNIWVVTFPGGRTVAHCGDQYNENDLGWLSHASDLLPRKPDVLIIDCWAMELGKTISGFSPKVVVSAHENEMGHSIDHREAFWLSLYKYDTLSADAVVAAWGEKYTYR